MKVYQTQNDLIIKENPGCLWIFGLFFALIGILFVYGAFNGFYLFGIQATWAAGLTFLLGLTGIAIGIFVIYKTPISHLKIDKSENEVNLIRWGIFGKKDDVYYFDEIERFCLIENQTSKGLSLWSFGLELIDGEQIKITSLGQHAEDYEDKYVYPLNVFIGKILPACQLNFQTPEQLDEETS